MIYLACPYSHTDPAMRELRFRAVTAKAAELLNAGHIVFSPITHSHPIAEAHGLPGDWTFWERFDKAFLKNASMLFVLMLPGWDQSEGVTGEIEVARYLSIPIHYITP